MLDLANGGFVRTWTIRGAMLTANLFVFVLLGIQVSGVLGVPTAVGQTPPADVSGATPTHKDTGYIGAVIPPGQEDLLAQMLGRDATLPGQCEFTAGAADGPVIRSTYKCSSGEVVFELSHPSKAPAGAVHTEQFALAMKSGSPPDGLRDALVALIRSHEAAFKWAWVAPPTPHVPGPARSSSVTMWLGVAGLLGCVVVGWLLYRRWRRAAKP